MGLSIQFSNPWLLFLLIPAAALVFIPYFTLSKKYRRTRNRVVAMVLESVILVLTVFLLAGMLFVTREANTQNEIIVLVDVSDTQKESEEERDDFVRRVIDSAGYEGYRLGIVTFGFTQEYAVPLTDNPENMFEEYLAAEKPDTTATDIAAALNYTKDLFESDSAKIVLVTDGKETDETAKNVIKSISAQGIHVDVAHVSSAHGGNEVQLVDVELPDRHINVNDECTLGLSVQYTTEKDDEDNKRNNQQSVRIELFDNGEAIQSETQICTLQAGTQKIDFKHTFTTDGLHEILFKLTYEGSGGELYDTIEKNNVYSKYMYLEVFNKVLVIESTSGQSELLETSLEDKQYEVTTVNVTDAQNMPATVDDLRNYDQVILNNIAYSDFQTVNPEYTAQNGKPQYIYPFVDMLYTYVNDYGGGLLTTGGTEEGKDLAHAYNRDDLINTPLQEMLPVQAVNYTPPLGLVIIVDRSGSMADEIMGGKTGLEWARSGAMTCLENMTERDYIGLLSLDQDFNMILPMTPRTQKTKIESAIQSIDEAVGGTSYPAAIERAGQMLKAMDNVQKKHIILMSDGIVPDSEKKVYEQKIENFYKTDRITFSVVGIGISPNSAEAAKMEEAVNLAGGRVIAVSDSKDFIAEIREELNVPEIKALNRDEPFFPMIENSTSPVMNGIERKEETVKVEDEEGETEKHIITNFLTVELQGFYGVKEKANANVILTTEYGAPLYAWWDLGKGKVGSFMCDVYGKWSSQFMSDANGKQFLSNAVFNLMPLESVRPSDISAEVKGENYLNQLSVYTNLQEGEYVRGEIEYSVDGETQKVDMNAVNKDADTRFCYVTSPLAAANNYSRCTFVVKHGGVYKIKLTKYNSANEALSSYELYKEFSYSKEYDINLEADAGVMSVKLDDLAKSGNGALIEDLQAPWEIFENFVTVFEYVFDPRILFAVIITVLFLLDVAVRKFKFKWIHEIVRDRRERKANRKDS